MSDKEPAPDAEAPEPEKTGKSEKADAAKKSGRKQAPLADLSAMSFGPAWAKEPTRQSSGGSARRGAGEDKQPSGRGRDDRRDQRKGGGGRRQHKGGGDRRQGSHGRRDDRRDRGSRAPLVPPPEGVKARIMPIEQGLDAMAKQISATGRTHSVFDLAWLVLGGLERFLVIFESEKTPLHRCRADQSLWLYQKECLDHFWNSGALGRYYDEEVTEVEPPSGNFQSVARCGLSGALIGPPNHHAYQQAVLDLHREKFSRMPLEKYKQKITMEHGEEVVQEWLESMKKHVRWRPKPTAGHEQADAPAGDGEAAAPAPPADDQPVVILDNRREVEQHFAAHFFDLEYETGTTMSVPANLPSKMISPALATLQKNTIAEARRYPGDLASMLCRQMSGRHLAVFKWKKRLHCGPARPKHFPADLVMAERPAALAKWVAGHPAGNIDSMWRDLLPADIDDEARHQWYHDLHWLINEGFVLLFSDGKLHAAKELEKPSGKTEDKPEPPEPQG